MEEAVCSFNKSRIRKCSEKIVIYLEGHKNSPSTFVSGIG